MCCHNDGGLISGVHMQQLQLFQKKQHVCAVTAVLVAIKACDQGSKSIWWPSRSFLV
jgi:hypothetical protein